MPTRVHAIVLVSKLHKPTLRALAFAKAARPNILEGVYVGTDAAGHRPAAGGVGRAQHRRPPQGAALAVPRGDPADRRVRDRDPAGEPARRGRGLHPGVRRRPLVGVSCCTTRPRCGSRAGCCSPPASWSSRCPTSCARRSLAREREERDAARTQAGDLRRGTGLRAAGPPGPLGQTRLMARRPRPRKSRGRSRVGERFNAVVGPVAHGGHCVVRLDASPTTGCVFARHALPGETVVLRDHRGHRRRPVLARRRGRGARRRRRTGSSRAVPGAPARACAAAATSSTSRCRRSGR